MSDFIKAKLGTNPTPLTVTVKPKVVGSTQIQLQLAPLPSFSITSSPDGSGWEKFNEKVSHHMITTVSDALKGFASNYLQSTAQNYLNEHAAFDVPSIPVSVDGFSVTLTPSDLAISTNDDHVMITGSVTVS